MSEHHGKFIWYELMTTDVEAAKAFYCAVVCWGTRDAGNPTMAYTIWTAGETGVGGLMAWPDDQGKPQPSWMGYVCVDDLDADYAKALSLGAVMHRAPWDIPGVGRLAVIGDPQDTVFVLMEPRSSEPTPPEPPPGALGTCGWRELMAKDWEAVWPFYEAMFGWTKNQAVDMGPMGTYQTFDAQGQWAGGMMTKPPQVPVSYWTFYFNVDSVTAAVDRIKAAGGMVLNGPMEVPGGQWIVQGLDPRGAFFSLLSAGK